MVCGTSSDVGKSRIVTGLCRGLARRDVIVAPFKAQNMSLNSTVTPAGEEIARSQALQAVAARTEPDVRMGPVLLKPSGNGTSQLIVMGRPAGEIHFDARWPPSGLMDEVIMPALGQLRDRYDVVILEGAGGAAEINLLDKDIVNLPLARRASVPAVLVGDIERGGVFASLYGSVALLPAALRAQLRGFIVNKFRGDERLLQRGIAELERRLALPCLGVIPHLGPLRIDEEDSLALAPAVLPRPGDDATVDIAIIALPHMSNFTDFAPLELEPAARVRYVRDPANLGDPDLVVLPGSKATVADLSWLRSCGLEEALTIARRREAAVLGICAGYQMLGTEIYDNVESGLGLVRGLGVLPVTTRFAATKITRYRCGVATSGEAVTGFEIRHGHPAPSSSLGPWFLLGDSTEGVADTDAGVWATSLHGLFENDNLRSRFLADVARRRGKHVGQSSLVFGDAREKMIDLIADALDAHLDMGAIFDFIADGTVAGRR
jgi:adenosylcobyric acid synthase